MNAETETAIQNLSKAFADTADLISTMKRIANSLANVELHLTTARPGATGCNGDRRHALYSAYKVDAVRRRRVRPRPGNRRSQEAYMRMRATALVGVALVLASGCGGQLGAGSVDAARAACIEAARKKGDQPIETENVRSLGEGRYEMSVRNKATLGSSVTTCTYDAKIGAAIR